MAHSLANTSIIDHGEPLNQYATQSSGQLMHVSHDAIVVEGEVFEVGHQLYPTSFFLFNTLHAKDGTIRGCGFLRRTFDWLLFLC